MSVTLGLVACDQLNQREQGAAVRNSPSTDRSAPAQIRRPGSIARVNLGIDFGTSFTKVCYPDIGTSRSGVIDFRDGSVGEIANSVPLFQHLPFRSSGCAVKGEEGGRHRPLICKDFRSQTPYDSMTSWPTLSLDVSPLGLAQRSEASRRGSEARELGWIV